MENEQEKPTTFFRFEDLRIYHKALEYVEWVHKAAKSFSGDPFGKSFYERYPVDLLQGRIAGKDLGQRRLA